MDRVNDGLFYKRRFPTAQHRLVGIDHLKRDPRTLKGKIVAIRKEGEATIKRLRIVSKDLAIGMPDNPEFMNDAVVLRGEEIDTAIIGKVVWWWGLQK